MLYSPLEQVLSCPGFNKLRHLPFLKAVFTPPVAVDNVAKVAASSALGISLKNDQNFAKFLDQNNRLRGSLNAEDITYIANHI